MHTPNILKPFYMTYSFHSVFQLAKIQFFINLWQKHAVFFVLDFDVPLSRRSCFVLRSTRYPRREQTHGHLHSRGGGARTSHLTPGYAPCRPTACGYHNVTALHYPSTVKHVILLLKPFGRKHCIPTKLYRRHHAAATM